MENIEDVLNVNNCLCFCDYNFQIFWPKVMYLVKVNYMFDNLNMLYSVSLLPLFDELLGKVSFISIL